MKKIFLLIIIAFAGYMISTAQDSLKVNPNRDRVSGGLYGSCSFNSAYGNSVVEFGDFFDYEINKYEMWADDQLVPLENEIIELNKEYEEIRKQIRKEHQASQKLQLKVEETKLSKRLKAKRQQLSDLQEEYMDKVDEMTERLQESMNNQFELTPFLKFHWSMV